jgi:hypothetical protein
MAQSEAPRRKIPLGQNHCPLLSPPMAISTLSPKIVVMLMQTEMSTTPVRADANGTSVPAKEPPTPYHLCITESIKTPELSVKHR